MPNIHIWAAPACIPVNTGSQSNKNALMGLLLPANAVLERFSAGCSAGLSHAMGVFRNGNTAATALPEYPGTGKTLLDTKVWRHYRIPSKSLSESPIAVIETILLTAPPEHFNLNT